MFKAKEDKTTGVRLFDFDSSSEPLGEAFRMLRLQIEAALDSSTRKRSSTILITSSVQSEGKTTVSCNLARVCAIAKVPTLLMDADFRKPMVHEAFGIHRKPGITDLLLEDIPDSIPIQPIEDCNLSVLPAGKSIKHTTEILGSPAFDNLLEKLRNRFKLIIIDSPPAGIVSDAGVLARKVEAIYIVVRAGSTNSRLVEKTIRSLKDLGGNVKGIIMSRIDARRDRYYYHHYYPQYYSKYYRSDLPKETP